MTDKGYEGYDAAPREYRHENGAANGRDADTPLMLFDTTPLPAATRGDGPDEEGVTEPADNGVAEADAPSPEHEHRGNGSLPDDDPDTADEACAVETDSAPGRVTNGEADSVPQAAPPEFTDEDRWRHMRMGEALLFASAEPLRTEQIAERLPDGADVERVLTDLAGHYADRGVNLVRVAGGWAFRTATDLSFLMERERVEQRKLSRAALETLAIIAYHQPVTRAEIEDVRGVSVSKGTLDVLMEIGWVRVRGRRQTPGRPVTYGTTDSFLEHFGLERVGDLPGLDELKAAGLLDTRMPTNISIPRPSDEDDPGGEGEDDEAVDLGFTPRHEDEEDEGVSGPVGGGAEAADFAIAVDDPGAEEPVPAERDAAISPDDGPAKRDD